MITTATIASSSFVFSSVEREEGYELMFGLFVSRAGSGFATLFCFDSRKKLIQSFLIPLSSQCDYK